MDANNLLFTSVGGAMGGSALDLSSRSNNNITNLPMMPPLERFPIYPVTEPTEESLSSAATNVLRAQSTG